MYISFSDVSNFLASYFHICLKSIYRKLTVKYAKLARSQISATVSGYNCGNANVLAATAAAGDFSPLTLWSFSHPVLQSGLCLHVIAVCLFA